MTLRIESKSLAQDQDEQCWKIFDWTYWNNEDGSDPQVTKQFICETDKEIDLDIIEVLDGGWSGYGVIRIEDSNNNEIIAQDADFYVVVQNLIDIIICDHDNLSDEIVDQIAWCISWSEWWNLVTFKEKA